MISFYMPSWMAGQKNANLKGWEDEMNSYKATRNMFKRMEVAENSMKFEQRLKPQLGTMTTVPVLEGNKGGKKSPRLPTP